ncbi:MAG: hypothetical protein NC095_10000 [Muribaculum sp.]|nr:hypothetical protein [Muribaculum sp.]
MKINLRKGVLMLAAISGGMTMSAAWQDVKTWDFEAISDAMTEEAYYVTYDAETVKFGKTDCNIATGDFAGLAFQGPEKWFVRNPAKGHGLYQNNGGGRILGVLDLKAEDKVVIKASGTDCFSGEVNGELDSTDGDTKTVTYKVSEDGNFGVSVTRYYYIYNITVQRNDGQGEDPSEPVGTVTNIVDQTFASGVSLTESADYTWGSEISSMLTDNGLYVTNKSDKGNNYENRDFITFTNPVGNPTHEVGVSYEVYSPKDKGQNNTYYDINYFNADGEFVFGIQEASGGWAYTANIVTANADGTTNTVALPKGHMAKGGGSVVNLTVKFAEGSAIVAIDGGSYTAYSKSEGIKAIKLSVTGENGYDRDMYIKNFMMNTTVVAASTFADYTLTYVCDGEVLKSETKSGSVGDAISLAANDTADFTLDGIKYIYVSNDAEGKTIAADGTTVVTLTYRKAAEYNYTVSNNVNSEVKSGKCVEGESVTIPYSRYILATDGVLWVKDATNKEYNYTFTPDADNYEVSLSYTATETTDAIFFSEAEDLEGMTATTGSNANIRCSNAAGGYADEAVEIYTLKAGTYKVTLGVWGNSGATFTVKAGEAEVMTAETAGYWFETTSEEFTITEETALTFEGANGSKPLDFVIITGKADAGSAVEALETAEGDDKWYNLQGVEIKTPGDKGLYIHNGKKVMVK